MITLILKDSVILFLLVYAILTLAEQFVRFLMRFLEKEPGCSHGLHVFDITEIDKTQLEGSIRRYVRSCRETIYLLTETDDTETNAIVQNLCREFDVLFAVNRSDFFEIIDSPKVRDAFLTAEQREGPDKSK